MAKLKLFISHSSRLDDLDDDGRPSRRNWVLLEKTCEALRDYYGDRIEILVDQEGLMPSCDWEQYLNEWLAECHVAIILFSKRAAHLSNWVKKEATILGWRRQTDPNFKLIPVFIDHEVKPEDLENGYFGTLKILAAQCVKNAKCEQDMLSALGGAETWLNQKIGSLRNSNLDYDRARAWMLEGYSMSVDASERLQEFVESGENSWVHEIAEVALR